MSEIDIELIAKAVTDDLFEVGRDYDHEIYRIQFMSGRLGDETGCGGLDKGAFIRWLSGALNRLIPLPTKQEWEGGLPPVGSTDKDCAIRALSKTDEFEVIAHRSGKAIVYFKSSPEAVTMVKPDDFRQIRTQAEWEKDELVGILRDGRERSLLWCEEKADAIIAANWRKGDS